MARAQRLCQSYLLEEKQGVHVWGTDVMKLALFDADAALSDLTTAYATTHEVVGAGYVAGGVVLALTATYPKLSAAGKVLWDFVDVLISPAAFATRYALVYNSSKANRAVMVIDFGALLTATVSFGIQWPVPDDNNATIRASAAA